MSEEFEQIVRKDKRDGLISSIIFWVFSVCSLLLTIFGAFTSYKALLIVAIVGYFVVAISSAFNRHRQHQVLQKLRDLNERA